MCCHHHSVIQPNDFTAGGRVSAKMPTRLSSGFIDRVSAMATSGYGASATALMQPCIPRYGKRHNSPVVAAAVAVAVAITAVRVTNNIITSNSNSNNILELLLILVAPVPVQLVRMVCRSRRGRLSSARLSMASGTSTGISVLYSIIHRTSYIIHHSY
jgi:hypothetical protein